MREEHAPAKVDLGGRGNPVKFGNYRVDRLSVGGDRFKILKGRTLHLEGRTIYYYRELLSTNTTARLLAESGVPDGTVVVSDSQQAGRGRMNRQWVCPPGKGILMSMILRPMISPGSAFNLTLVVSAAVAEAITDITGCGAGIKWPNDVLVNGKKVCGILAESKLLRNVCEYVIIGIGINVNQEKSELPAECRETTTSLRIELGQSVARLPVLRCLLRTWDRHYREFLRGGPNYAREKWLQNSVTLGRRVTITGAGGSTTGIAVDINEKGGLVVQLDNGDIQQFMAEDVSIGSSRFRV
ncbi:MAG: biotin--[acetyl-CoA-carboxylase] ligase [Syntrophomonadaceae bacterium]|nr:biotin--[acetyl-CoA-carboxylase] ligase [Syntrophomonadaceae bacterium]